MSGKYCRHCKKMDQKAGYCRFTVRYLIDPNTEACKAYEEDEWLVRKESIEFAVDGGWDLK